jgi:hypothetical protein
MATTATTTTAQTQKKTTCEHLCEHLWAPASNCEHVRARASTYEPETPKTHAHVRAGCEVKFSNATGVLRKRLPNEPFGFLLANLFLPPELPWNYLGASLEKTSVRAN